MKTTAKILLMLSLLILAACKSSLVVKGNFPKPMVDKLPHTLGVYYEPEFANYVYTEKSGDRSSWEINTGPAQVAMLSNLLPGMFEHVIPLSNLPNEGSTSSADLIFSPRIDSFQYAMPRETKINVYEIWIKYNMRVYNSEGQLLADWLMSAYGKTPTAFMKGKEDAVNEAAIMALRDMGASLSLRFAEIPEIKAWLADHQAAALAANDNQPQEGEDHVQ
jgi:hypothetical protein